MPETLHLLNPSGRHKPWARALTEQTKDMEPWAWVSPEHPKHTETLVDWALEENVRRLVVWGGDGTFHRVVRALWKKKALHDVELALVPAGTCNDLARRLALTRPAWSAWQAAAPRGRLASLCLARLRWKSNDRFREDIFINNAGFGRPRSSFENRDGSWAVLKALQPIRLTARWADGHMKGLYYMVLACNAPYFSGGLHFEKNVFPEEGVLKIYFVPATSKARLALRLARGQLGFPLLDAKITKVTALKMTIDTDIPVWPQADGEPPTREGVRHVEFSLLPDKVRVWVPA
jgi:diacylglycerol kinase family enzyme